MKRFITLIFTLITALSFVACEEFLEYLETQNPDNNENIDDPSMPNKDDDIDSPKGEVWSIMGAFNKWGNSDANGETIPEIPLTYKNGNYIAEITLYRGMGIRLHKDNKWDINLGAKALDDHESGTNTAIRGVDETPFELEHHGPDIFVPVAGRYFVIFNSATFKMQLILIKEVEDVWVLTGSYNDWSEEQITWSEADDPRVFAIDVDLEVGDEVIFSHNGTQCGAIDHCSVVLDREYFSTGTHPYTINATGRHHITLFLNTGIPLATFSCDNPDYTDSIIEEATWGIIGGFSNWENDTIMTLDTDKKCYYAELEMWPTSNNGFKIRKDHSWAENRGLITALDELTYGEHIAVYQNGMNLPLTESGIYHVEYYPHRETILVEFLASTTPPPTPEPPVEGNGDLRIYAHIKDNAWPEMYIWLWNDPLGIYPGGSIWPGFVMPRTEVVNDTLYYVYYLPNELSNQYVSIVFNSGNGEQTQDLDNVVLDCSRYFFIEPSDGTVPTSHYAYEVDPYSLPEQPDTPTTPTLPDEATPPTLPEDSDVDNTKFNHRILVVDHTGINCGYCPMMIDNLLAFEEQYPKWNDHFNLVTNHGGSFAQGDPARSNAAVTVDNYYNVSGYPTLNINFHSAEVLNWGEADFLQLMDQNFNDLVKVGGADAGIAVAVAGDLETVYATVAVKVAVEQEYKVTAWLLESDIYGDQTGATQDYHRIYNYALRNIGGTYSKNDLSGDSIGVIKAGDSVETTFELPIMSTKWKVENMDVLIIVSAKDSSAKWEVVNTALCPINSNVNFEYLE